MLELYCDAVVDLLSKGASPEAQSTNQSAKQNKRRITWWFLRDVFLSFWVAWFMVFEEISWAKHSVTQENIFKKINLKSSQASASLARHFHIFTSLPNRTTVPPSVRTKTSVTQRSRQFSRDPGDKKKAKLNIRQEKNGNVWGTQGWAIEKQGAKRLDVLVDGSMVIGSMGYFTYCTCKWYKLGLYPTYSPFTNFLRHPSGCLGYFLGDEKLPSYVGGLCHKPVWQESRH